MTLRRLLSCLALIALLFAPFGRIAAAEAMVTGHHSPQAMSGHCDDVPAPDHDKADSNAIDCMIACAAVATIDSVTPFVTQQVTAVPAARAVSIISGLHPEADPPPPRFS